MTLVLGGGLTGLSAAYALHQRGVGVRVLEAAETPGGASRTLTFAGQFRFDLGGHRLYTRRERVLELVRGLVGDELLEVSRRSRIHLGGRFADYPLSFRGTLRALGVGTAAAVGASYAAERARRLFRRGRERTFEDWIVRRFGRKLYSIYFEPYSEKVWGLPCSQLSADFAAQRIRGLSMREALKSMLFRGASGPATLASRFWYPRLGFGRIAEAMVERMPAGTVQVGAGVSEVRHDGERVKGVVAGGREHVADEYVATFSLVDLVLGMRPAAPEAVASAARRLRFRDLIVCFLALDRPQVTEDHWIYFSSPDVCFSRIHEPKNWSAAMAPADRTGVVAEIFCFAEDPVWREPDDVIARRIAADMARLGLIREREVSGWRVVRLAKAYPVYDIGYRDRVAVLKDWVGRFRNLFCAGRLGTFRYTSGDYCLEMGLLAAENVMGARHDLFGVGSAQGYAES